MKTWLKKHWPEIVVTLAAAIYLGKAGLFFYQNPQFTYFWDWPGHLQKAALADWPWKGGWDTTFWGGYPTWVYPNFYHLLLKLFVNIFHSDTWGAAVLTLTVFCLQLHGLWMFISGEIGKQKRKLMVLAFVTTVAVMIYSGGSFMGSFLGTLFTGGGPGSLATAVWLYFMAYFKKNSSGIFSPAGILFGLLFLIHPLTAVVAGVYLIFCGGLAIWKRSWSECKKTLFVTLNGILIGLPWILTQLDPSFSTTAVNLPSSPDVYPWILIFILIMVLINDRKKTSPLILMMIGMGLVAVTPNKLIRQFEGWGIRGLHFFRFIWFFNITFATGLIAMVPVSLGRKVKSSTLAAGILLIIIAIIAGPQPKPGVDFQIDFRSVKDFNGRVMDVSRHSFKLDYPQAMEHALIKETNLVGSTRWIFESGSRGLMFYSLKNALEPQSFKDGTYLSFFNDSFGKPRRESNIKEMADLLGVGYVSYTSENPPPPDRENIWKIGEISWTDVTGQKLSLHYLLEKIGDIPLVTTIDYLPESNPNIDLGEWWLGSASKSKLLTDSGEPPSTETNLSLPTVENLEVKPMGLSFNVASDKPAPVVIKFSYSPYWRAEAQKGGYTSQPVWITPGNMLVYGYGDITLDWKSPIYFSIFSRVSAAVAALTLVIAGYKRYK